MNAMTEPTVGHNSKGIAAQRLKMFIERIERLENDRQNVVADMREVYSEAKSTGLDPKIMRKLVRLRKMDSADREEQDSLLQVYIDAVGF